MCTIAVLREEKEILIGLIEYGRYIKLTHVDLDRASGLNGIIAEVTLQVDNIRGDNNTLSDTISLTEEEAETQLYQEIWVGPLIPLRVYAIFSDLFRNLDDNCKTLAKKRRAMARSAVSNINLTPTADLNPLTILVS